jgi:hypothetical protein
MCGQQEEYTFSPVAGEQYVCEEKEAESIARKPKT